MALIDIINNGFARVTELVKANNKATKDNAVLLPIKVGNTWYKSGLYYDYNYPFISSSTTVAQPNNNMLYALPYRVLEDTVINTLTLNCTTGQSGASSTLAVYSSNADNTINQLLASGTVDLSTAGIKTTAINLAVSKGQVIWLVSLTTATGTMASVTAHNLNSTARLIGGSLNMSQNGTMYVKSNATITNTITQSVLNLNTGNAPRVMFTV